MTEARDANRRAAHRSELQLSNGELAAMDRDGRRAHLGAYLEAAAGVTVRWDQYALAVAALIDAEDEQAGD